MAVRFRTSDGPRRKPVAPATGTTKSEKAGPPQVHLLTVILGRK
jgi:hypothetical protein